MLFRPSQLSVIPVVRSLVPIPDDVVETSDDDDDFTDHLATVASHVSHQPRPFAVRLKSVIVTNTLLMLAVLKTFHIGCNVKKLNQLNKSGVLCVCAIMCSCVNMLFSGCTFPFEGTNIFFCNMQYLWSIVIVAL